MTDTARDQLFSGLSKMSILTEHGDQVCWEAGEFARIIEAYVDARLTEERTARLIDLERKFKAFDDGESISIDTSTLTATEFRKHTKALEAKLAASLVPTSVHTYNLNDMVIVQATGIFEKIDA